MTDTNGKPPLWLQSAGIEATILLAIIAVLSALIATIHFTIQVDLAPQFQAIDTQLTSIDQRLSTIEQTLKEKSP